MTFVKEFIFVELLKQQAWVMRLEWETWECDSKEDVGTSETEFPIFPINP